MNATKTNIRLLSWYQYPYLWILYMQLRRTILTYILLIYSFKWKRNLIFEDTSSQDRLKLTEQSFSPVVCTFHWCKRTALISNAMAFYLQWTLINHYSCMKGNENGTFRRIYLSTITDSEMLGTLQIQKNILLLVSQAFSKSVFGSIFFRAYYLWLTTKPGEFIYMQTYGLRTLTTTCKQKHNHRDE